MKNTESTLKLNILFTGKPDKSFKDAIAGLKNMLKEANTLANTLAKGSVDASAKGSKAAQTLAQFMKKTSAPAREATSNLVRYNDEIKKMTDRTENYRSALRRLSRQSADPKNRGRIDSTEFENLKKNLNKSEKALLDNIGGMNKYRSSASAQISTQRLLNQMYQTGSKDFQNYMKQYRDYDRVVRDTAKRTWNQTYGKNVNGSLPTISKAASVEMDKKIAAKGWKSQAAMIEAGRKQKEQEKKAVEAEVKASTKLKADRQSAIQEESAKARFAVRGSKKSSEINDVINRTERSALQNENVHKSDFKRQLQSKLQGYADEAKAIKYVEKMKGDYWVSNSKREADLRSAAQDAKARYAGDTRALTRINELMNNYLAKSKTAKEFNRQFKQDERPWIREKAFQEKTEATVIRHGKTPADEKRIRDVAEKSFKGGDPISALNAKLQNQVAINKTLIPQQGLLARGLSDIVSKAKTLGSYAISGGIIYSVFGSVAAAGKEIIAYDQTLKNLQAITGSTDEETKVMGEAIKKVALETKFSAKEIGEGMTLIGQAGFDAAQSVSIIGHAAELSTGTMETMGVSVDLLTTSLTAFNMNSSEAARVADVMANAVNKSKLTIDKLRISFGYIGSLSHEAGIGLEETAANMEVLADHGLRASTIGTSLRNVIASMIDPNAKMAKALGMDAEALARLNPLTSGWEKSLTQLSDLLWDTSKGTYDVGKAFELFGLRGAQAAVILARAIKSGEYREYLEQLYTVGAAHAMAERQMEGLANKIENLGNTWKILAVELSEIGGRGALGTIIGLLKSLGDGLIWVAKNAVTGFIVQAGMWMASMALIARGVQDLIVRIPIFKAMLIAVSDTLFMINAGTITVGQGLQYLGAGLLKWLTNPITLAIITIGLAITALMHFKDANKDAMLAAEANAQKAKAASDAFRSASEELESIGKAGVDTYESHLKLDALIDRLSNEWIEYSGVLERVRGKYSEIKAAIEEIAQIRAQEFLENEGDVGFNLRKEIDKNKAGETIREAIEGKGKRKGAGKDYISKIFGGPVNWYAGSDQDLKDNELKLKIHVLRMKKAVIDALKDDSSWQEVGGKAWALDSQIGPGTYLRAKIDELYPEPKTEGLSEEQKKKAISDYESNKSDAYTALMSRRSGTIEHDEINDKFKAKEKALGDAKEAQQQAEFELERVNKLAENEGGTNSAARAAAIDKVNKSVREYNKALYERDMLKANSGSVTEEDTITDYNLANKKADQKEWMDKQDLMREGMETANKMKDVEAEIVSVERELRDVRRDSWKNIPADIKKADDELRVYLARQKDLRAQENANPHDLDIKKEIVKNTKKIVETEKFKQEQSAIYAKEAVDGDEAVMNAEDELARKQMALAKKSNQGLMSPADLETEKEKLVKDKIAVADARIAKTTALMAGETDPAIRKTLRDDYLQYSEDRAKLAEQEAKLGTEMSRLWEDVGKSAFNEMSNGFANVISKSKTATEAFVDFGQVVLNEITAIIAKLFMMTALMATIGATNSGKGMLGKMGVLDLLDIGGWASGGDAAGDAAAGVADFVGPLQNRMSGFKGMPNMSAGKMSMFPGGAPSVQGGGADKSSYTFVINATDANSFARMLATEPAQKQISTAVVNKYSHNDGIRRVMKKG